MDQENIFLKLSIYFHYIAIIFPLKMSLDFRNPPQQQCIVPSKVEDIKMVPKEKTIAQTTKTGDQNIHLRGPKAKIS